MSKQTKKKELAPDYLLLNTWIHCLKKRLEKKKNPGHKHILISSLRFKKRIVFKFVLSRVQAPNKASSYLQRVTFTDPTL